MPDDDTRARVAEGLTRQHLLPSGTRVIVGVSGGADSVALLHLLVSLQEERKLVLHAAHLDHGLRDASADDARFVHALAARWRVPATIERRDVGRLCREAGWSLEDGARRLRYQFLLDTARRQGATHLALAHTADDQAETVLMRLLRGTGLLGLGAIPVKRRLDDIWVVRPLLGLWRRDILAYSRRHQLEHREDATNLDQRFVRNRIRHELLPLLERSYNPQVKGALAQLAEQSRWDYEFLDAAAGRQWKRTLKPGPAAEAAIAVAAFLRQPKALQRQLVRRAVQQVRGDLAQFEFRHWREVEGLFAQRPPGSIVDLPGGVQFIRQKDRVICRREAGALTPAALD